MIEPVIVGEIISQYEKHGWTLRRALLSEESKNVLTETTSRIDVEASDFDALWFSRRSNPESEAWELRRLTGSPFALVAVISADATSEEVEATLAQVADEMRAKTIA
jgi:hypothetical protein